MSVPDEPAGVPLLRAPSGHLLVDVGIGTEPTSPFLVDTAASGSVAAKELLPTRYAEQLTPASDSAVHAAGGTVSTDRRVLRQRLRLGTWLGPPVELTVLPLGELSTKVGRKLGGILGLDALAVDELWLDLRIGQLAVSAGDNHPYLGVDLVRESFRWLDGKLIVIDVEVAGCPVTAVVDTGAAVSVVNDAYTRITERAASEQGSDATAFGLGEPGIAAVPYQLGPVRFGRLRLPAIDAYRAQLPVFGTLGLQGSPAALLGVNFFAGRLLGIRFAEQQILLSVPDPRWR